MTVTSARGIMATRMRINLGWRVVLLTLVIPPSLCAQRDTPIDGIVTNNNAEPVADVIVRSRTTCCPQKFDEDKSGKDGRFHLEHPGKVLRFYKEGIQPKTLVVTAPPHEIRVAVEPQTDSMIVAKCGQVPRGHTRISWGKNGIHFDVPEQGVKILGGTPDVDYVKYVIKPRHSKGYLQLWFGPYAMNSEPDDDEFLSSSTFTERYVVNSNGEIIGQDSRGQATARGSWRRTAIVLEGAVYRDASPRDAALFDQIIDSVCDIP